MKKNLFIAAAMLLCFAWTAAAQNEGQNCPKPKKSPEEMMHFRAENIATKLLLSDKDAAKFIPVYEEFLKAQKAINEKYRPEFKKNEDGTREYQSDKDIEANLRAQLQKSQEILDLRKAYLDKYLTVISARQVRELYRIEQEQHQHMPGKPAPGANQPKKQQ